MKEIPSFYQRVKRHAQIFIEVARETRVDVPTPRQVLRILGFATAAAILGHISGNAWVERFNELPKAQETMMSTRDQLGRLQQAYISTDDPSLREIILGETFSLQQSFIKARAIDRKWEDVDGLLLAGSLLTLVAAGATVSSAPIRRLRTT